MPRKKKKIFYGTTTMGEKGQVVVPAEARAAMKVEKGEKLLVFGMGHDMVVLSKAAHLEKFASRLAERLDTLREILKKNR